jgi:hypothetical protein
MDLAPPVGPTYAGGYRQGQIGPREIAGLNNSARLSGNDRPPSIKSQRDWRAPVGAATLFDKGYLLAGTDDNRPWFANPRRGCTPTGFFQQVWDFAEIAVGDGDRRFGADTEGR